MAADPPPVAERPSSPRPRLGLSERWARALPDWAGSIRFRLTALYSLFLFGLAALVVGGIYLAVDHRLHQEVVSREVQVVRAEPIPGGFALTPETVRARYKSVEQLANERALNLLRTYSFTALGLLFLGSLGVGWVVAGRVLGPIGRITAVARDIQATDLSRRIALSGPPDELKGLADTFDAMLARLDEAFEGQRRFIQEASHELRNPLAVIRTNLDVALADPDPQPADLRHTAELVRRTAERMSRLVDDLLVHARHGAPGREMVDLDVATVVTDAAAEFTAPAAARRLRLEAAAPDHLSVIGDKVALRQALANLLANAVRLAPQGSRIRIGAGQEGDWVWLAVEDEGPGIPAEQRDLVFQRFWQGDRVAGRDDGRSGLGLAIVSQIAEAHRGVVGVAPSPSGGSVFTMWLPATGNPSAKPGLATP
jgi:signal transduction histidine kinase